MSEKKRVFITVNPDLIQGKRLSTIRSVVTALDKICDLHIVPIDQYDFRRGKVLTYRRIPGGQFEKQGSVKPAGDLWIVYSDGYWLDFADQGFKKREDFLHAQLTLHEKALSSETIKCMINTPQAEKNCLKDWLAGLDSRVFKTVPTFLARSFTEVFELFEEHTILVAKPNWGGSGLGIKKIASKNEVHAFKNQLEKSSSTVADYCFQTYAQGAEKRLWYVNNQCVAARITYGRHTPWSAHSADFKVIPYDQSFGLEFEQNRKYADILAKKAKLTIGSIDFIGDQINEINGAGTTFIQYDGFTKIVDARKPLIDFLKEKVLD